MIRKPPLDRSSGRSITSSTPWGGRFGYTGDSQNRPLQAERVALLQVHRHGDRSVAVPLMGRVHHQPGNPHLTTSEISHIGFGSA
jgi:hypothetical protein